jgi:vacuolar protein-sorting-associated protein 4
MRRRDLFIKQMQGLETNMNGVLVLGATNVPWELDDRVRLLFQKRICISLLCAEARAEIFKKKASKAKHSICEADWVTLGKASEGYSGADISIVVNEVLMMPVRKCQTAKRFKKTPDGGWTPTFPSDP